MSKVKICGLRTVEDIAAVNAYKPDYAGMILSKPFWRYVEKEKARQLKQLLDPQILMTGVFVNEDLSYIAAFIKEGIIDIVQLHGQESNAYIRSFKKEFPHVTVIKAFQIREEEDIIKAKASLADFVLLDSGTGSGKAFNWKLIQNMERDYFLAGGLNPENVEEALRQFQPFAVDTSSGVETDRKKDAVKIKNFIGKVREI